MKKANSYFEKIFFFFFSQPWRIKMGKEYVYAGKNSKGELLLKTYSESSYEKLPGFWKTSKKIGITVSYLDPGINLSVLQENRVYSFRKTEGGTIETIHHVQSAFADLAGIPCPVIVGA